MICLECHFIGNPIEETRGNFFVELMLWLCFIVPGLIYTIWRLTTRGKVCPVCKSGSLIPENSPRGKELLKTFKSNQPTKNNTDLYSANLHQKNDKPLFKKWWFWVIAVFILFFVIPLMSESENNNNKSYRTNNVKSELVEPTISEDYKEKLANTFCEERSQPHSNRAVNLKEYLLMYETHEGVTLHPAKEAPSKENCKKITELCLKLWNQYRCEGIAERKIWIGMTENQLILSRGLPNDTNKTVNRHGVSSQWVYGSFGPYVYLEGANNEDLKVTSWQD